MKEYRLLLFIAALLVAALPGAAQTASSPATADDSSAPPPSGIGFAWWRAIDVESGPSKEEMFNGFLGDLASVAAVGYKALPPEAQRGGQAKAAADDEQPYYLKQGRLVNSGNDTDFAIEGQGFFRVQKPDGTVLYTRAGNFKVTRAGNVETQEGYALMPALTLTRDQVNLFTDEAGALLEPIKGTRESRAIYQFELWLPAEGAQVEREGVYFSFSSAQKIVPDDENRVYNRMLEMSTTEGAVTMAQMMETLYALRDEFMRGQENGASSKDLEFRIYMVDFLLKEYARNSGDITALRRFGHMVDGIAPSIAFKSGEE
jgi:hypothetical protein